MIIDYDHNPNITEEQRLQSLKESVQRMGDELTDRLERLEKMLEKIENSEA